MSGTSQIFNGLDGRQLAALDPEKLAALAENWQPEARAAIIEYLRSAQKRQAIIDRYANVCDLAKSIDPNFEITPALALIGAKAEVSLRQRRKNLMINMPPQEGKLIIDSVEVPTPGGWRKHGDLAKGDWVFHPSGVPIQITHVHPKQLADRRVHFSDGTYLDVHANHEWTVFRRSDRTWHTMETRRLQGLKLTSGPEGTRGGRFVYQLPYREAVILPEADLPIDPYTLGVWLGDGSSTKAAITHHPQDEYVLPYPHSARCVHADTGIITDYYRGGLHTALKTTGVFDNKHIPTTYLRGSIAQRRALLAGLIDTDGHTPTGNSTTFDNTNARLVLDTAELIRSLGYRANVYGPIPQRESSSGVFGTKPMWRVSFSPHDMAPARLPRKVAKWRPAIRRRIAITKIETLDIPQQGNCITVDSPDGLYLAGEGWTPTHNSTLAAQYLPLRALQLNPNFKIILATYGESLAHDHSRTMREIISRHGSNVVDGMTGVEIDDKLGFQINPGSNKVDNWRVSNGRGGVTAVGLHGSITGRGADLMIIDDPYKDMIEADSPSQREKVDSWMRSVARTRLSPNASIILIQCMTGDTPVLRPDGSETPLRDIRPGDEIATYDTGQLSTSTVLARKNQGPDHIKLIRTRSGRMVRANARHPFLTIRDGVETWVRLKDLRAGDNLIRIGSGTAPAPTILSTDLRSARASATPATGRLAGLRAFVRRLSTHALAAIGISATGTESGSTTTSASSLSRAVSARAVESHRPNSTCPPIGRASSASTTTMTLERSVDCSATTATSCSRAPTPSNTSGRDSTTWLADEIIEIADAGVEDVFDIQVARTENFIANGLVSHNTRWHPEDLAGTILDKEKKLDPRFRTWHHINIPAVSEIGITDSLRRDPGVEMISARGDRDWPGTRRDVGERVWYALYQGMPRNPSGGLFKRSWFEETMEVPEVPVAALVGIDPADTGKDDETGIIGGYACPNGKILLAEDWSGQYTSDQWARKAVELALRMGAREIAFEAYASADTYAIMLKRAWKDIQKAAIAKKKLGLEMERWEKRACVADMPFTIKKWRGRANADAVARSGLIRQAFETGKAKVVPNKMAVFVDQACDWQTGQHQPDRVSAAVVTHDRLVKLLGGQIQTAAPVDRSATDTNTAQAAAPNNVVPLFLRRTLSGRSA